MPRTRFSRQPCDSHVSTALWVGLQKPVNMTFTVTAKERYLWTLELKRRGLTAVSVLRKTMQEMMGEADR
jgi:hypothetical protein